MAISQYKGNRPFSSSQATALSTSTQQLPKTSGKNRIRNRPVGVMLKVRLLPPGMLESEFLKLLPEEWHKGNGKVNTFRYNQGKLSSRPGKPSHGSVAYLNVIREDDIIPLSESVKHVLWEDAVDTFNDSCLKAKPYLERCSYRRNPAEKDLPDAIQGTIDQDSEFQAFLASLTEVATKEKQEDKTVAAMAEAEKVAEKTKAFTPLIEFMREKRESGRNRKSRHEEKPGKPKSDDKKKSREKEKTEKIVERLKVMKKAGASNGKEDGTSNRGSSNGISSVIREALSRKSKRAGIVAVARVLQRDQGMSPGAAHRKARAEVVKFEAENKAAAAAAAAAVTVAAAAATSSLASVTNRKDNGKSLAPTGETSKSNDVSSGPNRRESGRTRGRNRGKGGDSESKAQQAPTKPILLLKKKPGTPATEPATNNTSLLPTSKSNDYLSTITKPETPATVCQSKAPIDANTKKPEKKDRKEKKQSNAPVTPGATQAFIKPVNAAQGVNESTLRTALSSFGIVNSIEVDRRKGFAYAEFHKPLSLVAAARASPIQIGQVQVQILERKDKKASAEAHAPIKAANASRKKGMPNGQPGLSKTVETKDEKEVQKGEKNEKSDEKAELADKGDKPEKSERSRGRQRPRRNAPGGKNGNRENGGGEKGGARSTAGASGSTPAPATAAN